MKKLSFIIMVLAISLAVFSSFTSGSNSFYMPNKWEIFGVVQNAMNGDPYPNSADEIYSARIYDGFFGEATSLGQALVMNLLNVNSYISAYNNGQFPSSVICSSDNQHICVATVAYFNSISNGGTLVDYNYGDYTLDTGL